MKNLKDQIGNKHLMIIDESEGIDFCEVYISPENYAQISLLIRQFMYSPEPESSQALKYCAQAMER